MNQQENGVSAATGLMLLLQKLGHAETDKERVNCFHGFLQALCTASAAERVVVFERVNGSFQEQTECFQRERGFLTGEKPESLALPDYPRWFCAMDDGQNVQAQLREVQLYCRKSERKVEVLEMLPITYGKWNYSCIVLENPNQALMEGMRAFLNLIGSYIGAYRDNLRKQMLLADRPGNRVFQKGKIDPAQALNVLCKEYTSVYYMDLSRDELYPIRVDSVANVAQIPDVRDMKVASMSKVVESYCKNYVVPGQQQRLLDFFQKDNLIRELSESERCFCRYRCKPNLSGQQFFEAQVIKVSQDAEGGIKVLAAFQHVDDLMLAEQRHQQELEEMLQKERVNNEVLSAISKIYYAIFSIDLEQDHYKEITSDSAVHHLTGKSRKASTEMIELCNTLVVPEYRARILRFFDLSTLADRLQDEDTVANEYLAMDGNWHTARFIAKRRNDAGRVTHVLYVTRLISDTKRREQNWVLIAEEANKANIAKTEFISQIAHDIRTPLNAILGFLAITRAHISDPEQVKYGLDRIRVAGDFLHALVDDVLDISRIENGQMKLQPEKVDIAQFFDEIPNTIAHNKMGKELSFRMDIHDISKKYLLADPLRLKQIYSNILTNSIKYTPTGGSFGLEAYETPGKTPGKVCLVAELWDTGIGMSKEYMEKMYSKFTRETDTRINKVSGYGLGLSIVKDLTDLMGGSIQVTSQPGKGTRFRLEYELPYCEEEPAKAGTEASTDFRAACQGMRVLIAEDNDLNYEVLKEILAMYGVACDWTSDGAACVERFREAKPHTYDAILMDMQMPNMNGLEATVAIRRMPLPEAHSIPILALTANAFQEDVQRCINAGMNAYLSKPVDVNKLMTALCCIREQRDIPQT